MRLTLLTSTCSLLLLLLLLPAAPAQLQVRADATPANALVMAGLNGLQRMANLFSPDIFDTTSAQDFAKTLKDGISFVHGFFDLFDTNQEAAMQRANNGWRQINNRLSRFQRGMVGLGELIRFENALSQYAGYQQRIQAMTHLLENFQSASSQSARRAAKSRLEPACKLGDTSALKLLHGITIPSRGAHKNLGEAIVQYTKFHKRKVTHSLLGFGELVRQGYHAEVACVRILEGGGAAMQRAEAWKPDLDRMANSMRQFDRQAYSQRPQQWRLDLGDLFRKYRAENNANFARQVYNELADKYYWREWFVMRHESRENAGNEHFAASYSNVATHYGVHHNKHVLVAHQSPNSRFTMARANTWLRSFNIQRKVARPFVQEMTRRTGTDSSNSVVRYAIVQGVPVQTFFRNGRVAVRSQPVTMSGGTRCTRNCNVITYIFG